MPVTLEVGFRLNSAGTECFSDPEFEAEIRSRWNRNLEDVFPGRYTIGSSQVFSTDDGEFVTYYVTDYAISATSTRTPEDSGLAVAALLGAAVGEIQLEVEGARALGIWPIVIIALAIAGAVIAVGTTLINYNNNSVRNKILDMVADGTITPEQGERYLNVFDRSTGGVSGAISDITNVIITVAIAGVVLVGLSMLLPLIGKKDGK